MDNHCWMYEQGEGYKKRYYIGSISPEGLRANVDAHADLQTNRQVSLLAAASIDKMRKYDLR